MGISLWEIVHIFLVVRFYFCLPVEWFGWVTRGQRYTAPMVDSLVLSLSLSFSPCVSTNWRDSFHRPFTRKGTEGRESGRSERRKKGTTREERGKKKGRDVVALGSGNGRDGEQCRVIEHKSHNTASGWHINYHRGPGRNFSQNSAKYSYLRRLYPLPSLSLFLSVV